MTRDGTSHGNLSGLPLPQDGEQPQDELDGYGVPVQDWPANGRIYLLGATASLICGVVSTGLYLMALKYHSVRNVPGWLGWLAGGAALLAVAAAIATLSRAEKKKLKLGTARQSIVVTGGILGLIGVSIWLGLHGATGP